VKLRIVLLSVEEELFYWCLEDGEPLVWVLTRWADADHTTTYNDRVEAYRTVLEYARENGFEGVDLN
jgi:hypothetical protein